MDLNEDTIDIFRDDVSNYTKLTRLIQELKEKELKPIQEKIRDLNSRKKELEQDLCSTLGRNNSDLVKEGKKVMVESTDNGVVLEYQVKKSMVPMTQKNVKDKMVDFFKNGPGFQISFNSLSAEEKGVTMFEYIYGKDNRSYKTKDNLKMKSLD